MNQELLLNQLEARFVKSIMRSHGEVTLEIEKDHLKDVLNFFKENHYDVLMDLTAVDYLVPEMKTKVIYWLFEPFKHDRVRIILYISRGESIASVTDIYKGANWYERELFDLFGIHFEGHEDLKRILMPDDWVGHPMLKNYALTEVPVEFKHDVKPKVPSEIIPNVKLKVIHD